MFDFYKYAETFNSGDDKAMVDGFWVDDLQVFSGRPEPLATGKAEWLKFLAFAHDGVREIMRIQAIIKSKNHIFAEIDMDFHASKDRPDYPFGHLEPGDFITVKMFVHYYMRGDKIATLKMASWPANVGVTDPPTRAFGPPPPLPGKARKTF
jgi:hypothetical protein